MKSTLLACLEAKLTPIILLVVIITEAIQKPYPRLSVHPESTAKIQQKIALIWSKEKTCPQTIATGFEEVEKNWKELLPSSTSFSL